MKKTSPQPVVHAKESAPLLASQHLELNQLDPNLKLQLIALLVEEIGNANSSICRALGRNYDVSRSR